MSVVDGPALILGGAGFLGSRVARAFLQRRRHVVVIDGFLPRTGADPRNLDGIDAELVASRIQDHHALRDLTESAAVIVDCMGWTCHRLALSDPEYDAQLNIHSHLFWLRQWKPRSDQKVIYLGSRGQYGNPRVETITEMTPQEPIDIQGIHKTAAESYFRYYSCQHGATVVSFRIPNCAGVNQPTQGDDIGLVGGFIRDLLNGKTVTVYGSGRSRPIIFSDDVANIIVQLADSSITGFEPFNCPAHEVEIADLARLLADRTGAGSVESAPLEGEVARIDVGSGRVDAGKLERYTGPVRLTPLEDTLDAAVEHFRTRMQ